MFDLTPANICIYVQNNYVYNLCSVMGRTRNSSVLKRKRNVLTINKKLELVHNHRNGVIAGNLAE